MNWTNVTEWKHIATAIGQAIYLDTDVSLQLLHLPQTGRDERGLAAAHCAHHCHQGPLLHSHVDAGTEQCTLMLMLEQCNTHSC